MRRHLWPTDIPKIAALPPGRRMGAWRFLQFRLLGHWESWLGLVACAVIAAIGSLLGSHLGGGLISGVLGAALGGAVGSFLFGHSLIYVARRYYAASPRSSGVI